MAKKKKKAQASKNDDIRVIGTNRRARHEYSVEASFEAGIVLTGTEVKSIRAGGINFKDSFANVVNNELWLVNLHIDEYKQGNRFNHEPTRKRKLLMHRREISKLHVKAKQDGYTLIPLKFYFKKSWVKVEIGVCRGKKDHDKRHDIAKRDAQRQIQRALHRRR